MSTFFDLNRWKSAYAASWSKKAFEEYMTTEGGLAILEAVKAYNPQPSTLALMSHYLRVGLVKMLQGLYETHRNEKPGNVTVSPLPCQTVMTSCDLSDDPV